MNEAEQEERRMSDLSDWASSVTSAADNDMQVGPSFKLFSLLLISIELRIFMIMLACSLQMNTLSIEQDMLFLKKDCNEKDATIKELTNLLHSAEVSGSQVIMLFCSSIFPLLQTLACKVFLFPLMISCIFQHHRGCLSWKTSFVGRT